MPFNLLVSVPLFQFGRVMLILSLFLDAGLRERLNKIMSSEYFTTTPEMKATVEVAAAAAGNYPSFQVPVHGSIVPASVPLEVESSVSRSPEKVYLLTQ